MAPDHPKIVVADDDEPCLACPADGTDRHAADSDE